MSLELLNLTTMQEICERLADGRTFEEICAAPGMPTIGQLNLYRRANPVFDEMVCRSLECRADLYAEEIIKLANDDTQDVGRLRLKITTRQWLMERLAPKRYGASIQQRISGENGAAVQIQVTVSRKSEALLNGVDKSRLSAMGPTDPSTHN
jgi:hypothetical protein